MDNDEVKDNKLILKIQKDTLENLTKYNENRKTRIVDYSDELKVPQEFFDKLHLVHREETFVDEDPSEYTEIEVVPYLDDDLIEESIIAAAQSEALPDEPQAYQFIEEKPPMQEWLDESDRLNEERGITVVETNKEDLDKFVQGAQEVLNDREEETADDRIRKILFDDEPLEAVTEMTGDSVNPVMERQYIKTPICEFCGNFVFQGQIHGMGYCREKIQYEQ